MNQFINHARKVISGWPGYQHIPDGTWSYFIKLKLRVLLSLMSTYFKMSKLERKLLKKSRNQKGTQSGKVLLLANGPSVNDIRLSQIKYFKSLGGKIAVMNGFHLSDLSKDLVPDYYFMMDPQSWNSTKPADSKIRDNLRNYIRRSTNKIQVVQPVSLPKFLEDHQNFLFVSPLNSSGLFRSTNPFICWGLASSTMLVSLGSLIVLGFTEIYYGGVDGTSFRYFKVNDLNEMYWSAENYHFYENSRLKFSSKDSIEVGIELKEDLIPSFADMLYAESVLRRDFQYLSRGRFVNVSGGDFSDSGPRACLIEF